MSAEPRFRATREHVEAIATWREAYRAEMACQIIHDSLHARPGWSDEYLVSLDGTVVGYGSVAVGGPWTGRPTLYECYVDPGARAHAFELCDAVLGASGAVAIEIQSNDVLGALALWTFATGIEVERLLFHDRRETALRVEGAAVRVPEPSEAPGVTDAERGWQRVVLVNGVIAGRGGVLFHYNPPYGDMYMEVDAAYRGRGLGALLVQELKRACREAGVIPAARCRVDNVASRRTLLKAGFDACGVLLHGGVARGATAAAAAPSP